MKMTCFALLFTLLSAATCMADAVRIETVKLNASPAISLEGVNHDEIDSLLIDAPLSIHLYHCSNITISACNLRSIKIDECDHIMIRNCWIHDCDLNGVEMYRARQTTVQGCRIEKVATGVWAVESCQIQIIGNFGRNVIGPDPRGELVQFDTVTGPNNAIRGNYFLNERGKSHPEDCISLYKSEGEENSPILVEDNYVTGDPLLGSTDKSTSGSGIMLADCGGAHQLCRHNVVISAGQVGIGVAGGTFIRVEENLVYGEKSNVSNSGIYAWNQSKLPSNNVAIIRNRVHWTNLNGEETSWWNGQNISELSKQDNHFSDATLAAHLPAPPSVAPMPPIPWTQSTPDGSMIARLPWKP